MSSVREALKSSCCEARRSLIFSCDSRSAECADWRSSSGEGVASLTSCFLIGDPFCEMVCVVRHALPVGSAEGGRGHPRGRRLGQLVDLLTGGGGGSAGENFGTPKFWYLPHLKQRSGPGCAKNFVGNISAPI